MVHGLFVVQNKLVSLRLAQKGPLATVSIWWPNI